MNSEFDVLKQALQKNGFTIRQIHLISKNKNIQLKGKKLQIKSHSHNQDRLQVKLLRYFRNTKIDNIKHGHKN